MRYVFLALSLMGLVTLSYPPRRGHSEGSLVFSSHPLPYHEVNLDVWGAEVNQFESELQGERLELQP